VKNPSNRHVMSVTARGSALAIYGYLLPADFVIRQSRACRLLTVAGLDPADWTPRELRHSFVSLMSDAGVHIEKIARLVGHTGTTTTETIYRKQIRPVITGGAQVMDSLFPGRSARIPAAARTSSSSG
jgi:integrase